MTIKIDFCRALLKTLIYGMNRRISLCSQTFPMSCPLNFSIRDLYQAYHRPRFLEFIFAIFPSRNRDLTPLRLSRVGDASVIGKHGKCMKLREKGETELERSSLCLAWRFCCSSPGWGGWIDYEGEKGIEGSTSPTSSATGQNYLMGLEELYGVFLFFL